MKRDYPNLCKPLKVGNLTFRNRMVSAPMGATDITAEGTPGLRTQGFYEARAKGGAAAVTVSELVVHPETDGSQMLHLSLATPGQLGAFAYVADAIKRHGAIASIELSHSGQYAGTYMVDKKKKADLCQWGPSDGVRPDGLPVRVLSVEQIEDIAAAYANAAVLARRAGFQMCMVHAGHGWLINQFLSPYFNKRTDEYGGSLENRLRFARQILTAIREATGPGFPIELRMSGSELFDGGYDIEEGAASPKASRTSSTSSTCRPAPTSLASRSPIRRCFASMAATCRWPRRSSSTCPCRSSPSADCPIPRRWSKSSPAARPMPVAMARALLADPELPNKVMANRGDEVVKCLRCFVCMAERPVTQTRRCAVNPLIGREFEGLTVMPTARPKRVLVAGGGIAGMKAAHTAALRGHDVTLCEASDELGGILRTEAALPFKYDMYELGRTYAYLCREAGVDIRLETPVTAALCEELEPDALIIAVGSESIKLPFPVAEDARVISIDELYLDGVEPGPEVAVIGGGLTGCECALQLARTGHKVHLIEMRPELAPDANIRHRPILLTELEGEDIDVLTGAAAKCVDADGVTVTIDGEERVVPCQSVIAAIGQRSRSAVVDELRDGAPFVRVIGDAQRPANITLAIYEAYHAGLDV